jgi:anti-anti-sigma factor
VLIGVSSPMHRQVGTLDFPLGAVLCLYTDGLVERCDQPIDRGIGRLCAAVTAAEPEAGCVSVMAAMADYSPHTDDVALLMLRRAPGEPGGSGPESPAPADASTAPERDVHWSGRHAVVSMPAEIDITNASGVTDLLAAVVGQSPEVITTDMTATTFCDSAGVSALARAYELATAGGSELRLPWATHPPPASSSSSAWTRSCRSTVTSSNRWLSPGNGPDSRPAPSGDHRRLV